jgi:hypothetical protein
VQRKTFTFTITPLAKNCFTFPVLAIKDALIAFTQLVRISTGWSGRATMLLLKRTSSIAFYQERSTCWHCLITFSFWVEFVISKWEMTLIRITHNCWHETSRNIMCVQCRDRQAFRSYSIIWKDNQPASRTKNVKTYQQEKTWKTCDSKVLMNVSKTRQVTAAHCILANSTLSMLCSKTSTSFSLRLLNDAISSTD